jgi:hypothetical protein
MWGRPFARAGSPRAWEFARALHAALVNERNALQQELTVVKRERDDAIAALRNLQDAVTQRWQAEAHLRELYRQRDLERAMRQERDPNRLLQ